MRSLSTTVPFGFDFEVPRFLAAYRGLGCVSAQFYRNTSNAPTPAEALRAIAAAGMSFDSIHGVFGPDIDPSSPDASHRAKCLSTYESEARLARDLGVRQVVVHPSANRADFTYFDRAEANRLQAGRWPHLDDFMRRLADIGDRVAAVFLIENVPHYSPLGHDPAELARRIVSLNRPSVRMCFDTGHAHVTGDVFSTFRAAAPAIDYLHIHDNDGAADDHRMPGDGTIDWTRFGAALRESALSVPCMLEVFYPVPRVEALAQNGRASIVSGACAIP